MVNFDVLQRFSWFSLVIFFPILHNSFSSRTFEINYAQNSFYMNGEPFRYVSGSVHYFRIPKEYWRDRLRKLRAAGLNAVSTYVEWSQHEAVSGKFNFSGDLNIKKFIEIAQEEDLYVILRPGPYICAERDFGGLPYWLMKKHPDVDLRSFDTKYIKYVERWINVLMKELSSFWYGKGGPIILVQVENEYGSYFKCDFDYLYWLRDLFKSHIEDHAVLFSTDGASRNLLKCGKIEGVYTTVDFGPRFNVTKAFEIQREFEPRGPLVNSEYYPGWLTHWGEKMQRRNSSDVVNTLKEMLDMGANVNFYMFHGGTNFGFTAGANDGEYKADITSYDYDAPITEAGDITQKYLEIQKTLSQYLPRPNISVNSSEKGDYGEITLKRSASLFSSRLRKQLGSFKQNRQPLSFEALNQNFGYVLYETHITKNSSKRVLEIKGIRDLAHVFVNGAFIGNMSREHSTFRLKIDALEKKGRLSVIVENLGRINFGSYIKDPKGILSDVVLRGEKLTSWNMTGFELKNLKAVEDCFNNSISDCDNNEGFVFYMQKFKLPINKHGKEHELDSFVDVSHLTKGVVFINGFNLGRYWSLRGPQYTLYVPGVYLKSYPKENTIIILEENIKTNTIKVKFRTTPIFT